MDWKFFLSIALPAIGAGFIWLISIARKDPTLYAEIDITLSRWIPGALFAVLFMGVFNWAVFGRNSNDPDPSLLVIVAILVLALLQLRSALRFFRRVAALPSNTPGTAPSAQGTQRELEQAPPPAP